MYQHIPQKSIELFVKGIIDKRCNVLAHIKQCRKCKEYYLKIGGKKRILYNPNVRRINDTNIC